MKFNPQPKSNREKLKRNSVAWRKRVDELFQRECGFCQGCSKWLRRDEAAPHHKKTYGSGGGDELDNLVLLCNSFCHQKIHIGELKLKVKNGSNV